MELYIIIIFLFLFFWKKKVSLQKWVDISQVLQRDM